VRPEERPRHYVRPYWSRVPGRFRPASRPIRVTAKPSPRNQAASASSSLAPFASRTIRPATSTTQTLLSSSNASFPAKNSPWLSRSDPVPHTITPRDSRPTARDQAAGPLRHPVSQTRSFDDQLAYRRPQLRRKPGPISWHLGCGQVSPGFRRDCSLRWLIFGTHVLIPTEAGLARRKRTGALSNFSRPRPSPPPRLPCPNRPPRGPAGGP
jgi:hypothetical protein